MTLQKALSFLHVIVNHACVGARVENLSAIVAGQEVDTLVDVLVEAEDPFQVLITDEVARYQNLPERSRTPQCPLGPPCLQHPLRSAATSCNCLSRTFILN